MAHFEDLSPCPYFGDENASKLKCVGWLDPDYAHVKGDIELKFISCLLSLLMNPWQPGVFGGRHDCGFCRISGGPAMFRCVQSNDVSIGSNNLFVPADGFLFVAPSTIIHYIDSHGYSPPIEFQRAVLECPEMRSMHYLKAILENGPSGLVHVNKR